MIAGIIKGSIITVALVISLNRIWVLPESMRDRCIKNIHNWHIERVRKIDLLAVDGKIKDEMVEFSHIQEIEQLENICGVKYEMVVQE